MPVFNEQASVRKVVTEWFHEVNDWTENFTFLAVNDGSTDETLKILNRLQSQLGERLVVLTHENRGHGQSCLAGYQWAVERQASFVFQIDSDGQCDPSYFFRFWRQRDNYDVIYGERVWRDDGWRRSLASLILKLFILFREGVYCVDANVPYRLMRRSALEKVLPAIPPTFDLANIAMAVCLRRQPGLAHGSIPIRFRERYGGEPTVRLGRFGAKAIELGRQLRALRC